MKKTERLNAIIYALKERGKLTAPQLAELFEVSERTIYRDIDALSQIKVPIIAREGLGGGYEIDMDYFIPSIQLTEQEVLMLLMVLKLGEELKLPNLTPDYQLLRSKIINTLGRREQQKYSSLMERVFFFVSRIEPWNYRKNVLQTVLEALLEERNLSIAYYHPKKDEVTWRTLSPQDAFFDEGGWYVHG